MDFTIFNFSICGNSHSDEKFNLQFGANGAFDGGVGLAALTVPDLHNLCVQAYHLNFLSNILFWVPDLNILDVLPSSWSGHESFGGENLPTFGYF